MIIEDQSETVAFLRNPASYGGGVESVEHIETHISLVFLAGDLVYKLKRAVRFNYVDYSTPERRAEACEAELALNRRTAPSLYLETRSIRRQPGGALGFGGTGPLVDTVVVMRRFDQSSLFDRLAQQGKLTPRMMRELADRIVLFHRDAEVDPAYGGYAGLAEAMEGIAANLAAAAVLDASATAALVADSRAALTQLKPLLEERREGGKVRLCHGDLHLRNICLLDGMPTLFDCIEFNRPLACVDVLYDLSFLLMDLAHRRLPDLAGMVFNRYFDQQAEAEGVAALPLFLSMHAAIRSHVAAAALQVAPEPDREALTGEARAYLELAQALLRPGVPRLIAIGGFSGTGKSTLAYGLAPDLAGVPGARVLRSDVIRKRLMGVAPETRLPEAAYDAQSTAAVYARLGEEAGPLLRAGCSVILDGVFNRPEERTAAEAVAHELGVDFQGLWLEAPPGVMAARIEDRRHDASDATVEILSRQLSFATGVMTWQRLDAGGTPAAVLAAAKKMIG